MAPQQPFGAALDTPMLQAPLLSISTSAARSSVRVDHPLSPSAASDWNDEDLSYMDEEAAARAQVSAPFVAATGFRWRIFMQYTGPGWLMSLAYLDPGNIEADLQSGAYTGYSLLWVLLLCHAVGFVFQVLAARLGVVTGYNLAELCRLEFVGYRRWVLWAMTELAIIGSDIQEVVGSAIAFQLLFGWPLWLGCIVTAGDSFTFIAIHFLGVRAFEAFVAVLIGTMALSFSIDCVLARPARIAAVEALAMKGPLTGALAPILGAADRHRRTHRHRRAERDACARVGRAGSHVVADLHGRCGRDADAQLIGAARGRFG